MLGIRLAFVRPPPSFRIARFPPAGSTGIRFRPHAEFAAVPVPDFHPDADALRSPTLELRVPKTPVRQDVRMDCMPLVLAAMLAWVRFPVEGRGVASFA